jgi:hypothetical protein
VSRVFWVCLCVAGAGMTWRRRFPRKIVYFDYKTVIGGPVMTRAARGGLGGMRAMCTALAMTADAAA